MTSKGKNEDEKRWCEYCDECLTTSTPYIQCTQCYTEDNQELLELCLQCFGNGAEFGEHVRTHPYKIIFGCDIKSSSFEIFTSNSYNHCQNRQKPNNPNCNSDTYPSCSEVKSETIPDTLYLPSNGHQLDNQTDLVRLSCTSGYVCPVGVSGEIDLAGSAGYCEDTDQKKVDVWTAEEDDLLLDAIETHGLGNWRSVCNHVKSKSAQSCESRYLTYYVDGNIGLATMQLYPALPNIDDTETTQSLTKNNTNCNNHIFHPPTKNGGGGGDGGSWGEGVVVGNGVGGVGCRQTTDESRSIAVGLRKGRKGKGGGSDKGSRRVVRRGGGVGDVLPPQELTVYQQKLLGYMALRDDFDREVDSDTELVISDLSVNYDDTPLDSAYKLSRVDTYRQRLRRRVERKDIAKRFGLLHRATSLTAKAANKASKHLSREEKRFEEAMRVFARFTTLSELRKLQAGIHRHNQLVKHIVTLKKFHLKGFTNLTGKLKMHAVQMNGFINNGFKTKHRRRKRRYYYQ